MSNVSLVDGSGHTRVLVLHEERWVMPSERRHAGKQGSMPSSTCSPDFQATDRIDPNRGNR